MAYDKVVDSTVLEDGLSSIADAIREKGNLGDPLMSPLTFPSGFVSAIEGLPVGIKGTAGTFMFPIDTYGPETITHNLGSVPKAIVVYGYPTQQQTNNLCCVVCYRTSITETTDINQTYENYSITYFELSSSKRATDYRQFTSAKHIPNTQTYGVYNIDNSSFSIGSTLRMPASTQYQWIAIG